MPGLFETIQSEIKARLDAQEFFSDSAAATPRPIPVLTEDLKDIGNQIQLGLARLGLAVVVVLPAARSSNGEIPGPLWDSIEIVVRVMENVVINRGATGIGVQNGLVCEAVAWHLHQFRPGNLGPAIWIRRIQLVPDPALLVRDVVGTIMAGRASSSAPTRED